MDIRSARESPLSAATQFKTAFPQRPVKARGISADGRPVPVRMVPPAFGVQCCGHKPRLGTRGGPRATLRRSPHLSSRPSRRFASRSRRHLAPSLPLLPGGTWQQPFSASLCSSSARDVTGRRGRAPPAGLFLLLLLLPPARRRALRAEPGPGQPLPPAAARSPALPAPLLRPAQAMNFGRGPAVVLNVGGTRYSFSREVLKDFPLRRVSRLHGCLSEQDVLEVCDDYDRERNEYFFDRHSEAFGFIMLYVRHGHLRFVPHMCELSFYNELIYWGLEGSHLDYCCQRRLDDRMSETCTYYSAEEPPGDSGAGPRGKARRAAAAAAEGGKWLERMRRTFEEPTSSLAAQVLATVSILFVIVSMVVLCASTLPEWRAPENRSVEEQSRYTAESVREPSG